ncbi:MAG: aromatic ring-opening dioxygenase LigA [Cellulomonadaceae bacterium]
MSAVTKSTKPVAVIGLISIIAGFVLIIAGGVVWGVVTSQLKAEEITVSAVTEENPGSLAGKTVAGPFTAFAQANAINEHGLTASGGKTYAELGAEISALKANGAADDDEEVVALQAQRNTVMNGSFLRASLFTSVVSYGICALVIGLGVMFLLIGWAFRRVDAASSTTVAVEEVVQV